MTLARRIPQALVAAAALVCAVVVYPSDLAWALYALGGVAFLLTLDFGLRVELRFDDDKGRRR